MTRPLRVEFLVEEGTVPAWLRGMSDGSPVVEVRLVRIDHDGTETTLDHAICATHAHSRLRTRCLLMAAALNLVMRNLRFLRDGAAIGTVPRMVGRDERAVGGRAAWRPAATALLALLFGFGFRVA